MRSITKILFLLIFFIYSKNISANTFKFNDSRFCLNDVRHPLLELQENTEVVSNPIDFENPKKILILIFYEHSFLPFPTDQKPYQQNHLTLY